MSKWLKGLTPTDLDRLIAEDKQHQAEHPWLYQDGCPGTGRHYAMHCRIRAPQR